MEGSQLPPTSTSTSTTNATNNKEKPDDPSSTWHRPTNSLRHHLPPSSSPPHPPPPPPPDPNPEIETYVVQVPRDQVYWTPPPENARIVERRLNSEQGKKKKKFCSKRLMWFFIAVIVIGFIICAIALIVRFVFKPEPPVFNVKKLAKPHHFEVMLTSKNPTSNMWVTYKGLVSLTYKNKNLCQGNFPELSQAVYGFDTVNVTLDGSRSVAVLPPEAISLVLTMDLNVGYGTGLVKRNKEVTVTCHVMVKGLLDAEEFEIVSERCASEFTK